MRVIPQGDTSIITEVMGPIDALNVFSAQDIRRFDASLVLQWCYENGVYQVPTTELIERLRTEIGGRRAIEIGAGNGAIGRALGIPRTDSYMQTSGPMRMHYESLGQAVTDPPPDVERLEAREAIVKYQPEVVIACWVTQLFDESKGDLEEDAQALFCGVDEEWILAQSCVRKYILVGNAGSHGRKRIIARPHREKWVGWLVSRAADQSDNRIWIWEMQ